MALSISQIVNVQLNTVPNLLHVNHSALSRCLRRKRVRHSPTRRRVMCMLKINAMSNSYSAPIQKQQKRHNRFLRKAHARNN